MRRIAITSSVLIALCVGFAGCGGETSEKPQGQEFVEEAQQRINESGINLPQSQSLGPLPSANKPKKQTAPKPKPKPKPAPKPDPVPSSTRFTGLAKSTYEDAKIVCGLVSPTKVAKDLGVAGETDPFAIAEAYAKGYIPTIYPAALQGCFEGLTE